MCDIVARVRLWWEIRGLRADLKAEGWSDRAIDAFLKWYQ